MYIPCFQHETPVAYLNGTLCLHPAIENCFHERKASKTYHRVFVLPVFVSYTDVLFYPTLFGMSNLRTFSNIFKVCQVTFLVKF